MNNAWNASAALRKRLALDEVARETVDGWLRNRNKVAMALSEARRPHLVFFPHSLSLLVCVRAQTTEPATQTRRQDAKCPSVRLHICQSGSHMWPDHVATARRRSAKAHPGRCSSVLHQPAVGAAASETSYHPDTQLCANIYVLQHSSNFVRRECDWTETDTPDGSLKVPCLPCFQVFIPRLKWSRDAWMIAWLSIYPFSIPASTRFMVKAVICSLSQLS